MTDFKWFLIGLIVLWIMWVASGGYEDKENARKQLLRQPPPVENWQPYSIEEYQW